MKKTTALLSGLLVCTAAISNASQIILDPGTLPSCQGWEYNAVNLHAGTAETDVFSADGSALNMNSMGQAMASQTAGNIVYRNYNVISDPVPTVLEWTSRTLDYENTPDAYNSGFAVGLSVNSLRYGAGISTDKIMLYDATTFKYIALDTTDFHTYRIELIPGSPSYGFYIDNVFQTSGTAWTSAETDNLLIGDFTGTANANVDITALEFTQIPEPATTGLLGIFASGIFFIRRVFIR